jgi:hypothetical protein
MTSQNNNARFSAKWKKIFVLLDCQNTHRRNGMRGTLFSQSAIFAQSDCSESPETLDASLLFIVTLEPYFTIRVRVGKGFKYCGSAVAMQVNGTDKGSNRIKCGRLGRRRRADTAV